jgi:hypothetical protein
MSPSILYLGLDVHKESVTIAVLPADAPAPTRVEQLALRLEEAPAVLLECAQKSDKNDWSDKDSEMPSHSESTPVKNGALRRRASSPRSG